jgi:SAM-dependent methyltransferase
MPESRDFDLAGYARMLEAALQAGYEFLTFDRIGLEGRPLSCLLRHDVDSELLGCGPMLDVERNLGVRATYFIMVRSTANNAFSLEGRAAVERILADGHRIGLHFMGERCDGDAHQAISEEVRREAQWLRAEFDTPIEAVSFHQPTRAILDGQLDIRGMVNTYNRRQMGDYFYVSDTNMHWRHGHPADLFRRAEHPRLHLLIHPMWWTPKPVSLREKWLRVLRTNQEAVVGHWQARERTLERVELLTDPQTQTQRSFSDKWRTNPSIAAKLTLDPASNFQKWILERNGFASPEAAAHHLAKRRRILDAGCGNGRVTALLASLAPQAQVIGIDLVDMSPARTNTGAFANVALQNADLLKPLDALGTFDFIYCQEVLHHTGDPERAFANLVSVLQPRGEIAIYVYRKKAPAREFMDDFVREGIAELDYDEAMQICRQITELGRRLSAVPGELDVEDIPLLGIMAGRYTPQRLLYHFFLKCYWNPALAEEENAVINYDWYHPLHSSRHTLAEVLGWFANNGLEVTRQHEDLYGITVHGVHS